MPKAVPLKRFALVAVVEFDQALPDPGTGRVDAADHFGQERVFNFLHPFVQCDCGRPDEGRPIGLNDEKVRAEHRLSLARGQQPMEHDATAAKCLQNVGNRQLLLGGRKPLEEQLQSSLVLLWGGRNDFDHCSRQQPGPQGGASEGGQADETGSERTPEARLETGAQQAFRTFGVALRTVG